MYTNSAYTLMSLCTTRNMDESAKNDLTMSVYLPVCLSVLFLASIVGQAGILSACYPLHIHSISEQSHQQPCMYACSFTLLFLVVSCFRCWHHLCHCLLEQLRAGGVESRCPRPEASVYIYPGVIQCNN